MKTIKLKPIKFKSIKSKLLAIILSGLFLMATAIASVSITITHSILHTDADSILSAQCETEATKINDALGSIEQSISIMQHYAETELNNDLNVIKDETQLNVYLSKLDVMLQKIAFSTPEATNYYIRLDPDLTTSTTGFYYSVDSKTQQAVKMETTDLNKYSPDDVAEVGWYYIPKNAGTSVWLSPYQQSHNTRKIISYVTPYYVVNENTKTFIGVIGIDLPYSFLTDRISSISVHEDGSAELHETEPEIEHSHVHLPSQDKTSHAKQQLKNGMYLLLEANYADIQRESRQMMHAIAAMAIIITIIFVVITFYATGKIIKPLKKLSDSANQFAEGNYDLDLEYEGDDEIATMAASLKLAATKLKEQIHHVSTLAFHDALTGVRSSTAFKQATTSLNLHLENTPSDFAVVVVDVNYLKNTNDTYGHYAGDQLLAYAANVLTEIFKNSYVYRIGGDEFTVILEGKDYEHRDTLLKTLSEKCVGSCIRISEDKEIPVSFAFGMATYTKELDTGFEDVFKHADSAMYLHKRALKKAHLKSVAENEQPKP